MPEGTVITGAMTTQLVDAVKDNVEALLPAGITIFAVLVGVSLIPKLIYRFL